MPFRPALIAAALAAVVSASQSQPPPLTAIVGAQVVHVDTGRTSPATVIVRNGLIDAVAAPGARVPAGAAIVEGAGMFVIPGLWDMHVHLGLRPEPEFAERVMLPLFLAHGVVGVRDMGGPMDRVTQLKARGDGLAWPRLLTPGPFVDGPGDAEPAFRRVLTADDARAAAAELTKAGADFLKVQAGLSKDAHAALVGAASSAGTTVAGHVPLSMTAGEVVRSGQRSVEHVSPALVGDAGVLFACSRDEDALLGELRAIEAARGTMPAGEIAEREWALRRRLVDSYDPARAAGFGKLLKERSAWLTPTLVWSKRLRPVSASDTGASPALGLLPQAMRTRLLERRAAYMKGLTPTDYAQIDAMARASARAVADIQAAGGPILAGTDTYDGFVVPGASLHEELRELVAGGLTPLAALRAATIEAAAYRGASQTEGRIAPGYRADLVLLRANPLTDVGNVGTVEAVVMGGRVHRRADLDVLIDLVRGK